MWETVTFSEITDKDQIKMHDYLIGGTRELKLEDLREFTQIGMKQKKL